MSKNSLTDKEKLHLNVYDKVLSADFTWSNENDKMASDLCMNEKMML